MKKEKSLIRKGLRATLKVTGIGVAALMVIALIYNLTLSDAERAALNRKIAVQDSIEAVQDSLATLEQRLSKRIADSLQTAKEAAERRKDSQLKTYNDSIQAINDSIERIEQYFSYKDGRHILLTEYVKKNLHDPESFQHVETRYEVIEFGTLKVWMRYRASNAFGALVLNEITALVDIDNGEVVQILEAG